MEEGALEEVLERAPTWARIFTTSVAAYEIVALWTDLPTITALVHRHPWLSGAIVGGLTVHFLPPSSSGGSHG